MNTIATKQEKKICLNSEIWASLLEDAKEKKQDLDNFLESLFFNLGYGRKQHVEETEEEYVDEELMKDIERVRKEVEAGNCVICRTKEENRAFLYSL